MPYGAEYAFSGIPFDQSVSNRPGTRFGPNAIRAASAQHAWGFVWPWRFDPFDSLAVIDYGDCWFDWAAQRDVTSAIENHTRTILSAGVEMLTFGGDHYVSYPLLKAHSEKHGPLALIQFDAHRDVEASSPDRISHGTMFGHAIREGLIDPTQSIQVGIRTTYEGEKTYGMKIIYADEVHETSVENVAKMITDTVGEKPLI